MSGGVVAVRRGPRPPVELTPAGITAVTRAAARALGLPAAGARLLKFTNNAVVLLPAAGAVVRIAGSGQMRRRVPTVVAAARWLEELELPAVRLYPGAPQPLTVGGHLITVWKAAGSPGPAGPSGPAGAAGPACPEPGGGDLARILRRLHAAPAPQAGLRLRPWDVTGFIRLRLREAAGVERRDLAFLAAELDAVAELVAGLAGVPPLVPPGVVHGDAFLGNLVATPSGPVLCDFDGMSVGPREWDLVPVAVGAQRFDYSPGPHEEFVRGYGVDVTAWPGYPALRRLRELQLVTSVLPVLDANPTLRPQWRLRLDSLRRRDDAVRWSPYQA